MLRQSLIYLLLSILVVVFAKYARLLIIYIDVFFTYVNLKLIPFFNQGSWGLIIQKTLILIVLPIVITAIPALIYKLIKGRDMPHFFAIAWIIWTIIVLSDILIR